MINTVTNINPTRELLETRAFLELCGSYSENERLRTKLLSVEKHTILLIPIRF